MSTRPFIAFDIETAPSPRALELPPDDEHLNRGVRDNFKPETAEQYRQRNAESWPEECAKRGALDWRLGRIVAAGTAYTTASGLLVRIGVVVPEEGGREVSGRELCGHLAAEIPVPCGVEVYAYPGERQVVSKMWHHLGALQNGQLPLLSGFAIRTFDLPWLLGRTAALDLLPSRRFINNRYTQHDLVDWADVLAWYDAFPRKGWTLAQYAEWFDLPVRPWGEGKDVPAWLEAGDYYAIVKHLAFDLLTAHALHERFAPVYLAA